MAANSGLFREIFTRTFIKYWFRILDTIGSPGPNILTPAREILSESNTAWATALQVFLSVCFAVISINR